MNELNLLPREGMCIISLQKYELSRVGSECK